MESKNHKIPDPSPSCLISHNNGDEHKKPTEVNNGAEVRSRLLGHQENSSLLVTDEHFHEDDPKSRDQRSSSSGPDSGLSVESGHSSMSSIQPRSTIRIDQLPNTPTKSKVPDENVPSYITSTPKKDLNDVVKNLTESLDYNIVSSKKILDDPLLSSIDGDNTSVLELSDYQIESIISEIDDESKEIEKTFTSRMVGTSASQPSERTVVYKSNFAASITGYDTLRNYNSIVNCDVKNDTLTSNGNLINLPVSPQLQKRVRENLFTLINSMENYSPKEVSSSSVPVAKYSRRTYLGSLPNLSSGSRVSEEQQKHPHSNSFHVSSKEGYRDPISSGLSDSQEIENSYSSSNSDSEGQARERILKESKSESDKDRLSELNTTLNKKYNDTVTSLVETQLKTLQFQQEKLFNERQKLALKSAEERWSIEHKATMKKYELAQEENVKLKKLLEQKDREKLEEVEKRKKELARKTDEFSVQCTQKNMEWEGKFQDLMLKSHKAKEEVAETYRKQLQLVMQEMKQKMVHLDQQHQTHVLQLNTTIAKLRATIREEECRADSRMLLQRQDLEETVSVLTKEKQSLIEEITSLKTRLKNSQQRYSNYELLEERNHHLESETKKLQEQMQLMTQEMVSVKKQAAETAEEKAASERKLEAMEGKHNVTVLNLNAAIRLLQDKLAEAVAQKMELNKKVYSYAKKEVAEEGNRKMEEQFAVQLEGLKMKLQQSEDSLRKFVILKEAREKEYKDKLALLVQQHQQELLDLKLNFEKDRSQALSKALSRRQTETNEITSELEKRYHNLITQVQAHAVAQIEEYKKAVIILKTRLRQLEERARDQPT
ncbi:uncharacterized protein LOC143019478 [Oratosquilla oratoria]|uniref:uncharacterized protein LOC143019478 n=1 Tax=Oratosquilla oratoria TaxID=337810 RepID=UPI003F757C2F